MNNKITIIEGPPPTFEKINSDWASSLEDTSGQFEVLSTNLRTMNGNGLIERCYQTWNEQETMFLHFKDEIGLEQKLPIVAAQNMNTDEGQKIVLWVRAPLSENNGSQVQ